MNWNVLNVMYMNKMFEECKIFNGDISIIGILVMLFIWIVCF